MNKSRAHDASKEGEQVLGTAISLLLIISIAGLWASEDTSIVRWIRYNE